VCGKAHSKWMISDVKRLKSYFQDLGAPYLPHLRAVNSRNARAVFHRYCAKFNRGEWGGGEGSNGSRMVRVA
jgi:hypothetical protein